jgi:hypothetical protein
VKATARPLVGSDTNPNQHFHASAGEERAIFSGNNRNDQ